jgi:hypothetical protein
LQEPLEETVKALAKWFIVLRQGSPEYAEGLSMNGKNYNDFKMITVRPEPVEGSFPLFARGSIKSTNRGGKEDGTHN